MNKPDILNPKLSIGTIIQAVKDYKGLYKFSDIKKGQYFVITNFAPGVYQPKNGFHSYTITKCSKNGKIYKWTNGFSQESFERNMVDGLFTIVKIP